MRENLSSYEREQPRWINEQVKHSISGFQQSLRYLDALFVISVEQTWTGFAPQNECELPREVVAILNARVHSLRPRWRMNVRGITRQKTSALAKLVHASRVNLVSREPVHHVDVELDLRILANLSLDLVVRDLAFFLVGVLGKYAHNSV